MAGFGAAALYQVSHSQFFAPSPNETGDTFFLKNGLEISVQSGDITKVDAAVVVVGEDEFFSGRGAVAKRLIKMGGSEYWQHREHLKKVIMKNGLKDDVYSCPAGSQLNFHQVFHALTTYKGGKDDVRHWDAHMKNLFFQIGLLAENNRAETVATPLLGAGNAGGSMDTSLEALVEGLTYISLRNLQKVILVEYDSRKASDMKEKLRQILDQKRKGAGEAAERAEHTKGSRIRGAGPFQKASAGTEERWADPLGSNQTHEEEAQSGNEDDGNGGGRGSSRKGSSHSDFHTSPSNHHSTREGHRNHADSPTATRVPNTAGMHRDSYTGKINNKIIADFAGQNESKKDLYNSSIQTETDNKDQGWWNNSRTSRTTGEGTPVGEDTQQRGRRAMNSEVPRQDFGKQAGSERDTDCCLGNAMNSADSSRTKSSSAQQPGDHSEGNGEGASGSHQDKERFQENDETRNEKKDKNECINVVASSPRNGLDGRDEINIGQRRSSSSKDSFTKYGTPPTIVHMSSDEDDEGEDKDKNEDKNKDEDEDEDKEISFASSDQGGRGHGKDDEDKVYKEPVIHYPPPSPPQTAQPNVMMWSSSQLSDDANSNADPSDTSPSLSGSDADHSKHLSQVSQSRHGDLTTAPSAEDESTRRDRGNFSNSQDSFQPKRTPEEVSNQSFGSSFRQRRNETESTAGEDEAFKQEAQARASEKPREERREPGPESVGGGSHAEGKIHSDEKPRLQLDGFPDCGTILIEYSFPNGVQGPQHPAPGQPYKGTFRRAFLPDNQEGRRVLQLLHTAFDRKLTFQLVQTGPGQEWGVEFADIPHKTSLRGGPEGNGYPDEEYLARVLKKLEYLVQP